MNRVLVLNGPNLGRLGLREPQVYGSGTHDDLAASCVATGRELGLDVEVRQTDDEATMLRWLHAAGDEAAAVVLNPAAWGHYSYALRDAVSAASVPVVEVHLTNPHRREQFRHVSVVSAVAVGVVAGFGHDSYVLALHAIARRLYATGS